ncbi:hypothetical protein ATANTOWER_017762 [Ataeniobius toweri]|uniref:Uncharacterized protein n=1 Tax=Ataeniobius toweri TaxID=208326 RepID=A0ABU7AG85_9TELE|nr:hypothetical protein [Ataeniobius toweri]
MKEKPPSSSCSPGNIRETRTRLSLLDVSHASQEEEYAAHTVKIKGRKKSECPSKVTVAPVKLGQHRGRFSLFWSSRTWTGRKAQHFQTFKQPVCEEGCSKNRQRTLARSRRSTEPPGRSLVQSCAAGTRPGVSGDP